MNSNHAQPIIFPYTQAGKLEQLKVSFPNLTFNEQYQLQLDELVEIHQPGNNDEKKKNDFLTTTLRTSKHHDTGNWIFYPWNQTAVHLLEKKLFQKVLTSRNYPLINRHDQKKFANLHIGIVGLSVGSSIALTLVHSGSANSIKLADHDTLSLSNLNRIRTSITQLGEKKSTIISRQIYEVNPYANITVYPNGVNPNNIQDFFLSDTKLDIVFDECDDLITKKFLRLYAQELGIPLVMTSDNGFHSDTNILQPKNKPTSTSSLEEMDRITKDYKQSHAPQLSIKEKLVQIASLLGPDNIPPEMQQGAVMRAENKIPSWPQLGMTVFLGGGIATYVALRIAQAKELITESSFSLKMHLDSDYYSPREIALRTQYTTKFKNYIKRIKQNKAT